MKDTGFYVRPENANRLASFYAIDRETKALVELTPAKYPALSDYLRAPDLESGGGGLVSTLDDYSRFCQMLLNRGVFEGARILAPSTVAMMLSDQLPSTAAPEDDPYGSPIGGPDLRFGVGVAVMKNARHMGKLTGDGTVFWGGAGGTWFWIDPENDLFFLGMIQRYDTGAGGGMDLNAVSQAMVYAALLDPSR